MPLTNTFGLPLIVAIAMSAATAASAVTVPQTEIDVEEAGFVEEVGGSERINFSGKLRMLSQRIPAAACNMNADVAPEQAAKLLKAADLEFRKIIAGLEHGEPELGIIGPEQRRKTLAAIEKLHHEWDPIDVTVTELLEKGHGDEHVQNLADHNMDLLGAAKFLVSEITSQYADPTALLQADALRIDIAGRQRMLTQKMSKEACLILSGVNAEASAEAIQGTINMFDTALNALRFGMPAAGIKASPEENIVEGLEVVAADWAEVKPHLDELVGGATWDHATREKVFLGLNKTMADMNKVVGMYSDASKLGL